MYCWIIDDVDYSLGDEDYDDSMIITVTGLFYESKYFTQSNTFNGVTKIVLAMLNKFFHE